MKIKLAILSLVLACASQNALSQSADRLVSFDFTGDSVSFTVPATGFIAFDGPLSAEAIQSFYGQLEKAGLQPLIHSLLAFKEKNKLDDWLYYQLIRKTAQQISPKAANYPRYTLYKWFLLMESGYDATVKVHDDKILFYVQSDEAIYNIPYYTGNGKQYVCLNYHDYGSIDFTKEIFTQVNVNQPEASKAFSYKVTHMPGFNPADYKEKDVSFNYNENEYHFRIKLNPQIKTMFTNYPVVDYASYFNIPLSSVTYSSLIPSLKKYTRSMTVKNGVDYLMRFTRYAFLFKPDAENFGKEKRLSPEQTLLYDQSDCEDRAALFFYLIKEIYDLPMIVLAFDEHVTIAVKFDRPVGTPIMYNGVQYSVCEPTPQKQDLRLGQLVPNLEKAPYEIVYSYMPSRR